MSLPKQIEALAPKFSWWRLKGRAWHLAKAAQRARQQVIGSAPAASYTDVVGAGRMSKPTQDRRG